MRKIKKRKEPSRLVEWRAANQVDPNDAGVNYGYDALRQSKDTCIALMNALLAEQGTICAYTGKRINAGSAHIEHLMAQAHCQQGEDVDYQNMVACWPQPNGPHGEYGAHVKASWPAPSEAALFVSPLSPGCEARFKFNQRGEISATNHGDVAATTTIANLKLCHKTLTSLRRAAIDGVLGIKRDLSLKAARQRLRQLEENEQRLDGGANVQLDPYCFALKQALRKFIKVIESLKQSVRGKNKSLPPP